MRCSLAACLSAAVVCAAACCQCAAGKEPGAAGTPAPASAPNDFSAAEPVPVPEPSQQAMQYYRSGNLLWVLHQVWGLAVPALILFTGLSARLRDGARKVGRKWFFVIGVYYILYSLFAYVLDLPLDYYTSYLRPHDYGLSNQALSKWLGDSLKELMIGVVFGCLFLWVPYLLIRKSPRRWWLYTSLFCAALMFFVVLVVPIWIEPLFNRFGSLEYILYNAYVVRYQQIGKETETGLVSVYLNYPSSLIYGLFALCLARIGSGGGKWYKAAALYFFLLIFLNNLATFGRNGILYAIFCIMGFFAVFRTKGLITAKNILLLTVLFVVLTTPRLIRTAGGDFSVNVDAWLSDYSEPYLRYPVPRITKQALDAYIDYSGGIYALDDYIYSHPGGEDTLGFRTLTPVFRFYNRLVGIGYVSTIDPGSWNLPFGGIYPEFNVYTFIRDLYGDFGILGVAIVPCLIGLFFGALFNCRGVGYDALKIYSMGWLLYTPVCNIFSFGGFLISFVFLLALNRAFRNRAPASPATRPAIPQSPAVALSLPAGRRCDG